MSVPRDKILKINSMIESVKNKTNIKIREFARLIGTLVSVCPAVTYGWAHIKNFEREKYRALRIRHRGNYEGIMEIPEYLKLDFSWWQKNLSNSNINLIEKPYFLTIYTDASLTGWGASCKGQIASGAWSPSESHFHINYLELLAVLNGLKSFAKEPKNCNILLRVDNITAISYINRMGGIKFAELNDITRKIWEWCEERKILIFASYINTRDNDTADAASRKMHVETEYSLHKTAFNEIRETFGTPQIDLFASYQNKKCKVFASWHPDPECTIIDAFTIPWNNTFFYAFPPFPLLQKVINKIKTEKAKGIVVYPIWKSQPWFPILENLRSSDPIIFTPYKSLLLSPFREEHPMLAYLNRGVPESAIEVLVSSLADSTIKQYNSTYAKWWAFCKDGEVFTSDSNKIIEFLNTELQKGANYNTINQHRSALNTLLQLTDSPLVTRFMKGAFRIRPVFPRYNETWDPNPVLTYLNNLTPLASLTLEKLTYKFVVLLALISSQRVQTLTKVKLSNITYFEDKIEIKITDIIKTSAPGKCQPILTLPYFHENPNLCIATILKYYIDTTQQYRNSHDQLLITIKKPHHPASAQTVAKWIKKGLALGGVNTDIFKSHSTRHASTSAAFKKGLSIESIRRTAGWSEKSSTFNKFYNRPLSQNKSFAEYLLNEK
ncbi:hypothetical protein NQ315_008522 [Exocentrus adspersus]|uniref:Tyr recombinase domain-containing protein n=1 Tax=Exocentrus adspersus TaxID=1586481 RepID=A0AAV8W629_9CUCU|nr:hypothetical protein NQ315_008522 [Exocentrus adspersus]